ncbi:hypothetical protein F5X98DRAFT_380064 [Xylaria grammica]|nr:hypothetical protein F5X98DRAFT_380064 [Xylaria grammica]
MNNTSPKYRVENWQIPVPIGDASAHFLVKVVAGNQKGKVINAFFMDGGENPQWGKDTASGKISQALAFIDEQYESKTWKFDAIVTTHHDGDHYRGLEGLLKATTTRHRVTSTYRQLYFADKLVYYSGNPGKKINGELKFIWSPEKYCRALAGENAIGIDMFSGTRIFYRYKKTKNLELYDEENSVRQWNPDDGEELRRPRFVIVGANGHGVHLTQGTSITEGDPSENQKSLLAVVYWPGQGRTSYFTGGDGNPKVELEGVVPWMNKNTEYITNKNEYYPRLPVDMVKLDHHGSLRETLNDDDILGCHSTILHKMKPRKVLVTPGNRHGHPNWVIMQLVRNYFLEIQPGGRMYTTRSPYWMSKQNINVMDANTNHASFDKVKQALETIGRSGDEEELNHDSLFKMEMENWLEDSAQNKKQIEDWAKQLRALKDWRGYFNKDGKPNLKVVEALFQKELQKEEKKTKQQLKASKKEHKSGKKNLPRVEEPELTNGQILKMILKENRSTIVWHAREAWSDICDQKICDRGSPYFLIRFWFEEDGDTVVDCAMDENGQAKRPQDPYGTKEGSDSDSEYMPIEDGEDVSDEEASDDNGHSSESMMEQEVTKHSGTQSSVVTSKNKKTGKETKSEYEYAPGVENYEGLTALIRFEMMNINFQLARDFTNIATVEEMEANNSWEWLLYGTKDTGKRDDSPTTSALSAMTSAFVNPKTAPSSEITGKGRSRKVRDIIESANWTGMNVTDPSGERGTVEFDGDEQKLLSFKLFVERYCGRDLKAYVTNKGPVLDGPRGTRPNPRDKALLVNLFKQWTGLRDHRASAATAQYQTVLGKAWRPLKTARQKKLLGPGDDDDDSSEASEDSEVLEDSNSVLGKRKPAGKPGKDPKPARNPAVDDGGGRGRRVFTRSQTANSSPQDATGKVQKKFKKSVRGK